MGVVGTDINPMADWIVRQALAPIDLPAFRDAARAVASRVEARVGDLHRTRCTECGATATVKYFLWVKQHSCSVCGTPNDLFPGYLIAKNDRHSAFVWYCPACRQLAQVQTAPAHNREVPCPHCGEPLATDGAADGGRYVCRACTAPGAYPGRSAAPTHRLFAMEYLCTHRRAEHPKRFRYFKVPDEADLSRVEAGHQRLSGGTVARQIPQELIPDGDQTARLHRWGYHRWSDLFNNRQLFGLGSLASEVRHIDDREVDVVCMALGNLSRLAIRRLAPRWNPAASIEERLDAARMALKGLLAEYPPQDLVARSLPCEPMEQIYWRKSDMTYPFEVAPSQLEQRLDELVDTVWDSLQSEFMTSPAGAVAAARRSLGAAHNQR